MRSDESLKRAFPLHIRERGDDYFAAGRVVSIDGESGTILCVVNGEHPYSVELKPDGSRLAASCDCRYFTDRREACKHIWAAIREASRRLILRGEFSRLVTAKDPPTTRPGRSEPEDSRARTRTVRWKSFFDALPRNFAVPSSTTNRATPGQLLYVVVALAAVPPVVTLEVRERSRKRNGEWGQPRPLRIEPWHLPLLEQEDRELLLLLDSEPYGGTITADHRLRVESAAILIERMARSGRLYLEGPGRSLFGPLPWDDSAPWHLSIELAAGDGAYTIDGILTRGEETLPLTAASMLLPTLLLTESFAAPLEPTDALGWVEPLRRAGRVEIPASDREDLVRRLLEAPPGVRLPPELSVVEESAECTAIFRIVPGRSGESFEGKAHFRYADREVAPGDRTRAWIDGTHVLRRDFAAERAYQDGLDGIGMTRDVYGGYAVRSAVLGEVLERLIGGGWKVELDGTAVRVADDLSSEVVSGIDWFDLKGGAAFGDELVSIPALLEAVERRRPVIALSDGTLGVVPEQWMARFQPVLELAQKTEGALRFRNRQALLIEALLGAQESRREREGFQVIKERIAGAGAVAAAHESDSFRGELRAYQREGLGWLQYLAEAGLGGCLADDMGLGKTVQVLALLDRVASEAKEPSLVVAPRSLLFNWKKEAERFTPHLRVLEHHGQERGKTSTRFADYDIILTTYATLRLDAAHFSAARFEYVILDEAQAIKNASSQVSKAVRLLKSTHRLALSGTPIENHIGELWSLFEFLNPTMLGPSRWFHRHFTAKGVPPERRQLLGAALRPLILRRTKEQVAPELPPRTEQTLYCELGDDERKRYDELRQYYRSKLVRRVREEGIDKSRMQVLEALLRLRQAACHPALLGDSHDASSSKVELLMEELSEVLESGHRALVFSQFTSFLALIREALDGQKIPYLYLDGSTRDRGSLVERFQSGEGPPLFLISLKAGGLGLNLTAADYVFLLDPWWNPAVEAQAIDRAHRIGQDKPVVAYRLIARDTVEEKILELQATKRGLADSIITDENSVLQSLDSAQLEALLD